MNATFHMADRRDTAITGRPTPTSVSASSPASTSRSSTAGKEKRLKLRASCDACAASKIRCSKEHPMCARCSANKSQCVYGVSRKHGKPGRKRKRNPDGTPFVKATKRCLSSPSATAESASSELQYELRMQQAGSKTAPNGIPHWEPMSSLSDALACGVDATWEFMYTTARGLNDTSTDDSFSSLTRCGTEIYPGMESHFPRYDPLVANHLVQPGSSIQQTMNNYTVHGMKDAKSYPCIDMSTMRSFEAFCTASPSGLYSPMEQILGHGASGTNSRRSLEPFSSSNCGYGLACSAFNSEVSWSRGAALSSPVSEGFCASSSSPSLTGVVSPFTVQDVQQGMASDFYMQSWHLEGCGFDGTS
jgi:hypothetical protein